MLVETLAMTLLETQVLKMLPTWTKPGAPPQILQHQRNLQLGLKLSVVTVLPAVGVRTMRT